MAGWHNDCPSLDVTTREPGHGHGGVMQKYMERVRAARAIALRSGALAAALATALACTTESSRKDTLAQDSTLALATAAESAKPQLRDVPSSTTPAPAPGAAPATAPSRAPAAAPARTTTTRAPRAARPAVATTPSGNTVTRGATGGGGAVGTIAAGTRLELASSARVCTNTNRVGDVVTATLQSPVTGSNGAVIPAGARVRLAITELARSNNVNEKIRMGFAVRSVTFGGRTYPVDGSVTYAQVARVRNQPQSKDIQKVATGAAVGAVVGQIIGHNTKSTVVGGAVGAAAGAGAAAATANYEGCVPAGGRITVALNSPLQVRA